MEPAHAKQVATPSRQESDLPADGARRPSAPEQAVAANAVIGTSVSPCAGAAYPAGNDRYMQVHLRPANDAMDIAVTPHRTACAARVDYLSQARA